MKATHRRMPSRGPRRDAAERRHIGALHGGMVEFQYLEEALRSCVEVANHIIRAHTHGLLSFKLTPKDLETAMRAAQRIPPVNRPRTQRASRFT